MPGLLRGVARTAAVAGTATAVSGRVRRRQTNRWAQQEQQPSGQPQPSEQEAQPAPSAPGEDRLQQLKDLGALKEQGVLTEAEFTAEKARILAG